MRIINDEEERRLNALHQYGLLDTEAEEELNALTQLAAAICNTPIALISLIDKNRQWFKAKFGVEIIETERSIAFCNYTITQDEIFEVYDAHKDERFAQNPWVTGNPNIRFYSGAPLITEDGYRLGSLCVIDKVPKELLAEQKNALRLLSKQIINNFELRRSRKALQKERDLLEESVRQRTAELTESNNNLIHANRELDRFVYSASHELRAPLKSILGLSRIALKDFRADNYEYKDQYLTMIEGATLRLDRLVNDIIDYSRNTRVDLKLEEIGFSDLVTSIINDLSYMGGHSIEPRTIIEAKTPFYSDRTRLSIIFSNIISNAFKYSDSRKDKSYIAITIKATTSNCLIEIEDNGIGIPEECLENVYNMFFRATEASEGAGLGLYIVKEALNKLKGKIEVSSKVNEGTNFKIEIPNNFILFDS